MLIVRCDEDRENIYGSYRAELVVADTATEMM